MRELTMRGSAGRVGGVHLLMVIATDRQGVPVVRRGGAIVPTSIEPGPVVGREKRAHVFGYGCHIGGIFTSATTGFVPSSLI